MVSVYEIPAGEYNEKLAVALQNIESYKIPEWGLLVKTGMSKTKTPEDDDFWFKRAASILRQLYINKLVGVGRLRVRYGSKQNRGMKPEKFKKSGGKIIRLILQQSEEAGFVEKAQEGKKKGRRLTIKGKKFLEAIK